MLTALTAAVGLGGRGDVVTLRQGGRRPYPAFYDPPESSIYFGHRRPFLTAFLNGRTTGVVASGEYQLVPSGRRDARGQTFGYFDYIEGMNTVEARIVGYTTARGSLEFLAFEPQAIDDAGRVGGVRSVPSDPALSDPYDPRLLPRGVLWSNGREIPLGLAERVWFG